MAKVRKVGDLEIPTDLELQRITWTLQRWAWLGMAAILLAAVLGLFGGGMFARAMVGQAGTRVDFERFCRLDSPTTMDVRVAADSRGEARVWVDADYIDRGGIERVDPLPARVESSAEGLTYVATAAIPGESTRIRFHLRPNRPGLLRGRIRTADGVDLKFTQFVHP